MINSPSWFAHRHLGLDLYDWQIEALESIAQGVRDGKPPTSLVASNGSGKTQRVIAVAILWFLWRYPRGWCPITSGSWMQVEKQLFPAMHTLKAMPCFAGWTFNATEIRTPEGGQAIGFSTDNAGRAEGWHPKISNDVDPVFYVADEAKTVPDPIFDAIGRCTLAFHLMASSPGPTRGKFYRSHHDESSEYTCIKATSWDCPHIQEEKIDKDRRILGESHPVFRSMHLAEFTDDEDRLIITPIELQRGIDGQPELTHAGEVVAFCDFAAGRDENVLAVRRNNHAKIVHHWKESDTMQAVGRFIELFKQENLTSGMIWGDADGLGKPMIDAMAERGWYINEFRGGASAVDNESYANLISEVWHVGAREIAQGRIHLGTIEPELFRQLTTRKSEWNERGKLRAEPKDKMAKAGIKSPDRADALLGCIFCGSRMSGALNKRTIDNSAHGTNHFAGKHVTIV